jgi:hypothetical protein
MRELPILFSGAMVRALLDGRKTQTRRMVMPQPANGWDFETPPVLGRITSPHPKKDRFGAFIRRGVGTDFPEIDLIPSPYGMPGDRLWVRETCRAEELPDGLDGVRYSADSAFAPIGDSQETAERWIELNAYRGKKGAVVPAIHMPRWASRITLKVAGARVERLQGISEVDAAAEGVESLRNEGQYWKNYLESTSRCDALICLSARESFRTLWDSLATPDADWQANPWVWVIEFKRVTP